MSIRLGIVGAGAIGANHLHTAKRVGVPVTGIADANEAVAKKLGEAAGVAFISADAQELFASDQVDAVAICVPNSLHAPLSIAAMQAGKDVLVEKPMALSVAQCQQMNDVARQTGRVLQVGFVHRSSAVAQSARAFIDAGRLGRIYHAKANYYRRRGIPGLGGWFTTKALSGGGPLIDLGVHVIDLVMHLMKFPKVQRVSGKVYANFGSDMKKYLYESMWAGPPRYEGTFDVEDAAHALIRLEGGITLELNATWAGNFPEGALPNIMGLFGDKGGMSFQLGGKELKLAVEEQGHNVDMAPRLRDINAWDEQLKAFVQSVQKRTPPIATGEQGQVVQSIIEAIYESSRLDREVEL